MNIYGEMENWVVERKLPYWEQYALDLVVSGTEIGDVEIEKMTIFLLEDNGVVKKEAERPILDSLATASAAARESIVSKSLLKGISATKNINALADGQMMEFGNQLTAIFGANSSGKSGYARLLANAGFSRGDKDVLHDVMSDGADTAAKEAVFHIEIDGTVRDVPFSIDDECLELTKFYVHDTVSIARQLAHENEFSFAPFGLDCLAGLADLCDQIGENLNSKISNWEKDNTFVERFEGASLVREQVAQLSGQTDISYLRKLATLSHAETEQKKDLETKIAKLRSQSVADQIKKRSQQLADLKTLVGQLQLFTSKMGDSMIQSIAAALKRLNEAKKQAEKVGIERFETELFSQVGTSTWQRFLESAHALAKLERNEDVYPEDGDHCLLCRQKLTKSAIELIRGYWTFLEDDSRQRIKAAQGDLATRKEAVEEVETDFFGENTVAYRMIDKKDPDSVQAVREYVRSAKERRKSILKVLTSQEMVEIPPMSKNPAPAIVKMIQDADAEIQALKKSDSSKEIEKLEGQLRILKHRELLNRRIEPIAKYIAQLNMAARAAKLKPNTHHITLFQGKLFDKFVTDEYVKTFQANLKALGRSLPVSVQTRNNKGTSLKEIRVHNGEHKAIKVLSDGEKRIASLADFLTEVSLDPDVIGIALDDPVTSLDIEWKEDVAKRLIDESKVRQTIIFTHDLHFLFLLKKHAEEAKVTMNCHWIARNDENGSPGNVYLNNSPALEKDFKSSHLAELHLQSGKSARPEAKEHFLRQGFSALRTSYEALVMYEMFGGVVERFQERTRMDLLEGVCLDKQIFQKVKEKHALLSAWMEGHLHSDQASGKKPTPEMLKGEIDAFNEIKKQVKAKKKAEQAEN